MELQNALNKMEISEQSSSYERATGIKYGSPEYYRQWGNKVIQEMKEKGANIGDLSDGYHTFNELYEMRAALTAAFFRTVHRSWGADGPLNRINPIWKTKLHDDGTMFEGYFLVAAFGLPEFQPSSMISFHYPMSMWDVFDFAEEREKAPPYDGHTSEDVLERIRSFARMTNG